MVDGKTKTFKAEDVEPQNPPKYELMEDMANMTYLSEASVVNNLNERYTRFLIYTYSGNFTSKAVFFVKYYLRSVLCNSKSVQVATCV